MHRRCGCVDDLELEVSVALSVGGNEVKRWVSEVGDVDGWIGKATG